MKVNLQNYPTYPNVKENIDYGEAIRRVDNLNLMYIVSRKDNNAGEIIYNREVFACGKISKVVRMVYDEAAGKDTDYRFYIGRYDNPDVTNEVVIPKRLYGQPGMIPPLVEAGLYFLGKHSNAKRAMFIIHFISENKLLTEEKVYYHAGLRDEHFHFIENHTAPTEISQSCEQAKQLVLGEEKLNKSEVVSKMFDLLSSTGKTTLLLLAFMAYSLMHTILTEKGYMLRKILLLSGRGAETAARFLQIYNKNSDLSISLKNNLSSLKKSIFNAKDCAIIFKGDGDKLDLLKDIFCDNNCPEAVINGKKYKVNPQALCVLISYTAIEKLGADCFYYIQTEDISFDELTVSWFIGYLCESFMKKYREGLIEGILRKNSNKAAEWFEDDKMKRELTIFLFSYDILCDYFGECGFVLGEILNDKSPEEFFAEFIDGEDSSENSTLLQKLKQILTDAVSVCKHLIPYEHCQMDLTIPEDELLLLYCKDKIYIYAEQFERFIVSQMPDGIGKLNVLTAMEKAGYIRSNNGNHAMRLSLRIGGNKSRRSNWIAISRNFIEEKFALPVLEEKKLSREVVMKILLGQDINGNSVYLPLDSKFSNNRHTGITGDSGAGKTYATLSVIKELANAGIPAVIIDCAESFRKDSLDKAFVAATGDKLRYVNAYSENIPLNIFKRQTKVVDGKETEEKSSETALRCAQIIGRACGLAELQINAVYRAINHLFAETPDEDITLSDLCDELQEDKSEPSKKARAKLAPIVDAEIFREEGTSLNWKRLFDEGKILILSLAEFENESFKKMIAECVLQDLWNYAKKYGSEAHPFAVVADEIGVTPPKKGSALANMLTLGRKFGVMCIWNTQFLKDKFSDEEISNLNQSSLRLYFNTSDSKEKRFIAEELEKYGSECMKVFNDLPKGWCLARGTFCSESGVIYSDKLLRLKIPKMKE